MTISFQIDLSLQRLEYWYNSEYLHSAYSLRSTLQLVQKDKFRSKTLSTYFAFFSLCYNFYIKYVFVYN